MHSHTPRRNRAGAFSCALALDIAVGFEMTRSDIQAFLAGSPHAVVGASPNRRKFGNKVLRTYLQHGMKVFAVNPNAEEAEGLLCYPDLAAIAERIHGVSIITPPAITEGVVDQAIALGIKHVWMQPGAESASAVRRAEEAGINVIADGSCLLRELGFNG